MRAAPALLTALLVAAAPLVHAVKEDGSITSGFFAGDTSVYAHANARVSAIEERMGVEFHGGVGADSDPPFPFGAGVGPCFSACEPATPPRADLFVAIITPVGATGLFKIDGPGTNDCTVSAPLSCSIAVSSQTPFAVYGVRLAGTSPFFFDWAYVG